LFENQISEVIEMDNSGMQHVILELYAVQS